MSKPAGDLSALFRSLGPDDSSFQAIETAAARDAEQRWPLFQAVSPSKSETTPTLSVEERERWTQQEKQVGGGRKPALSLPGLSDKLAKSLGRMAGPRPDAPIKHTAKRAQLSASVPSFKPQPQPQPQPPSPSPSPSPSPAMLHVSEPSVTPKSITNARTESAADPSLLTSIPEPKEQRPETQVFSPVAIEPLTPTPQSSDAKRADNSLASIFSRLEEKPETINRSIDKKSSFLTRLGKR